MPNWCSTKYVVFTDNDDKTELKRLFDNLTTAITTPSGVDNGFGTGWLGDVAIKHGFDWETYPCRGTIEHMDEYDPDSNHFSFDTETVWGPCYELWEAIIEQYEGVSHVFLSEEPGCCYFVNTDNEGRFLPEQYLLELYGNAPVPDEWYESHQTKPSCLDIREYFSSFDELIDYCTSIIGHEFSSIEELHEYFNSVFDEDANVIANIREFEAA